MRRKNKYMMRTLNAAKKVTLPNGRNFYARVPRSQLPDSIIMKRKYKRKAAPKDRTPIRKGQRGQGFLSGLKQIAKNPLVKQIGKTALKEAINYAPQLCNLRTSKIKNKTGKEILQSDAATNLFNNFVTKYGGE